MSRAAPVAVRVCTIGVLVALGLAAAPTRGGPSGVVRLPAESTAARNLRDAITHQTDAAAAARARGDVGGEATAMLAIGRARLALADQASARDALTASHALHRSIGDDRAEASTLDLRGTVGLTLADTRAALADFTRALALRRQRGDRPGEAQTLSNLGLLHSAMDDDEGALEHTEQAWQLFRSLGNQASEATVVHNLAEVYLRLGDGSRALQYGRMALALHREFGPPAGVAHTLEHMASAYELLGDGEEAARHYQRALEASRSLPSRRLEAGILARLGSMQFAAGQFTDAAVNLTSALDASRDSQNPAGEARVLSELGQVRAAQGRADEAGRLLRQALALGEALESARLQVHARAGLAELAAARGDLAAALQHSDAIMSAIENLRGGADRDDLRMALSAVHDDHHRRHIDILMTLHAADPKGGFANLAYRTVERARARTLLEALARTRAPITGGVPRDLAAVDLQLRREIGAKAARLSQVLARADTETEAAHVRRDIDALISQYHENRSRIRGVSPAYSALMHPVPIELEDVQRDLLDGESVLLQYSLGRTRSFVWAITPGAWMVAELPSRLEIEGLTRRAYQLLTARSRQAAAGEPASRAHAISNADREWITLSRLLSRVLLTPVAPLLGYARVAVVGDGPLDYLPFGALPDPTSARGAPMLVAHEVVRLPSTSALAESRRRRPAPSLLRSVAILADPVFSAADSRVRLPNRSAGAATFDLRRLRFSRDEALAIAALVGPADATLVLDFDATRDALLGDRLGTPDILHVATHGILDTEQPELSGLVLSTVDAEGRDREGRVRLPDIFNMPLGADLVVLSGCETALGRTVRGEGLIGLTRGFLHAGASRVISSLWRVDDRATAQLMTAMYRGLLRERLRPPRALRDAQLSLMQSHEWAAPYYWAAFELSGEWR